MAEWIPTTEDLPEPFAEVLVTYITPIDMNYGFVGKGYLDGNRHWFVGESHTAIVTAWQPLPEPYREVKE